MGTYLQGGRQDIGQWPIIGHDGNEWFTASMALTYRGQMRQAVSASHVGNIVGVVKQASTGELAGGLAWYASYGKAIAAEGTRAGLAPVKAIALFACMSPQASIQRNWANFRACLDHGNIEHCVCLYPHIKAKAMGLLQGTMTVEDAARGDKVSAFFSNLCGDLSPVTVDKHAADCADGWCMPNRRISHKAYREYALAYQAAAKLLDMEPAQVQAVAWIVWRRLKGIHDNGGLALVA